MKTILTLLFAIAFCSISQGQQKQYKALFLGNSYTYVNDLPSLISQLAASTGDQLTTGSYAPGGYTLQQHSTNSAVLGLIAQGTWDYVVLQEQSQLPSFPDGQVAFQVYPYAEQLVDLIKAANACTKPVFYMTWGRKSGDQDNCPYFTPLCTYEGMDDLLQNRYTIMAEDNASVLCPVAKLRRYLRVHYPAIELYQGDGSHPSLEGSYAAACAFYSTMFKKDPASCTFSSSLDANVATIIRNAAKLVVYDSLETWDHYYPYAKANYSTAISSHEVTFSNESENATDYTWDFGDGTTSTLSNPVHAYQADGNYQVTLTANKCGDTDVMQQSIQIGISTGIAEEAPGKETGIRVYPNPAGEQVNIESQDPVSEVSIADLTGHIVKHTTYTNSYLTQLDIQDLEAGSYFLTIQSLQKTIYTKFHKK